MIDAPHDGGWLLEAVQGDFTLLSVGSAPAAPTTPTCGAFTTSDKTAVSPLRRRNGPICCAPTATWPQVFRDPDAR